MRKSQGAMANKNGKTFEKMMVPIFNANDFEVIAYSDFIKNEEKYQNPNRYVLKNVPYTTIYGTKGKTEFVIVDGERRVRIEAKYQASAGSVDEKYPYMLLNAVTQYPEQEVVFVLDGGGYKQGAFDWLEDYIKNDKFGHHSKYNKDIRLMKMADFLNWFNHEFCSD